MQEAITCAGRYQAGRFPARNARAWEHPALRSPKCPVSCQQLREPRPHANLPSVKLAVHILLLAGAVVLPPQLRAAPFDHSHTNFSKVLSRIVKDDLVDYPALKTDHMALDRYLDQLAQVPEPVFKKFSEKQKIAFLINLYNASTLQLIVRHYPIKSTKDIGSWLTGPFDQKAVQFMGRSLSLGDVEHHVLRRNHDEPRFHFAIVSAAIGFPPLRKEAYQEEKLDEQLDDQIRRFLRQPSKNRVDLPGRMLHLSRIFKWYEKDLSRKAGSLTQFVANYLDTDIAKQIRGGGFEIAYTDFDWSLNDLSSASVPRP
ncbi:MAG: DUF547 domain-containing protein [Pedosphaera sp.]|nr:DUF547 domain-containing protein [Pedosphaera sp.]